MTPKVSIYIPVYNTEKYIGETIESVLNQTYSEFELIVVDDCSQDGTVEIIKNYVERDNRIRFYQNECNLGMMPNWNHALSLCNGQYIGKLDADDLWSETFVEKCVAILDQDREVGLVCSGYKNINEKGKDILEEDYLPPAAFADKKFSFKDLLLKGADQMYESQIAKQGIGLMRSSIFERTGDFSLIIAADTEMWFRTGIFFQAYCINEILHKHRIWSESHVQKVVVNQVGLAERNLFEATNLILDNYIKHNAISYKQYKSLKKKAIRHYMPFKIYQLRFEKKYLGTIVYTLRYFLLDPLDFLKRLLKWSR